MRRLLILGISITAFAFSLFLMDCGPVANNNTATGNSPSKPSNPAPTPTPDAICTTHNKQQIEDAIADMVARNDILYLHFDQPHPGKGQSEFHLHDDGAGFKLKLEGKLPRVSLPAFIDVMQHFAAPDCVRRIIMVTKGFSKLKDEEARQVNSESQDGQVKILDPFEWDLICEAPNKICPNTGDCVGPDQSCDRRGSGDNSNTGANMNQNRGINANTPANNNANANR